MIQINRKVSKGIFVAGIAAACFDHGRPAPYPALSDATGCYVRPHQQNWWYWLDGGQMKSIPFFQRKLCLLLLFVSPAMTLTRSPFLSLFSHQKGSVERCRAAAFSLSALSKFRGRGYFHCGLFGKTQQRSHLWLRERERERGPTHSFQDGFEIRIFIGMQTN